MDKPTTRRRRTRMRTKLLAIAATLIAFTAAIEALTGVVKAARQLAAALGIM